MKYRILPSALAALFFTCPLHAQVPGNPGPVPIILNYQGRVAVEGVNFDSATAGVPGKFRFVMVDANGAHWWRNSTDDNNDSIPDDAVELTVTKGLYSVMLGDVSIPHMERFAQPEWTFAQPDLRLRVWFDDGVHGVQLLSPDQRLAPAAYYADRSIFGNAIALAEIQTRHLAAGAVESANIAAGAVESGNLAAGAVRTEHFSAGTLEFSLAGAPVAGAPAEVGEAGSLFHNATLSGAATAASPLGIAVPLYLSGATNAVEYTILEVENSSATGFGLAGTGSSGVFGAAHATYGYGVYGLDDSPTSTGVGVVGNSYSGTGIYGMSVWGKAGQFDGRIAITGGPLWTAESWAGSVELANGSAIGWETNAAGWRLGLGHSTSGGGFFRTTSAFGTTSDGPIYDLFISDAGNVGIGTTGPQAKLDVNGTIRTKVLRITGGADIAEPFQMQGEELEKGSVVVIDDEHPGRLKRSARAYDTRVAGIVSGANGVNPGIALHQEGVMEGGQNVALTGRVYVQADATGAPIKPGDLLTTSNTPGHAMKVTEPTCAQGAVIGKAMSSLAEGSGMVLVLVTLQ